MMCESPSTLLRENGKLRSLSSAEKFEYMRYNIRLYGNPDVSPLSPKFLQDIVILPCKHCLLCRATFQEEWATRCWLELQQYDNNMFITLTYNEQSTPQRGVYREEISRFMRTLREHFRRKHNHTGIRYYACGEYGEKTARPHYHLILFNCPSFGDEKFYKTNKQKQKMYQSEILNKIWHKGNCVIGSATRHSIGYVTKFTLKATRANPKKGLNKEFHTMSNHPGLGNDYFMKNIDSLIADDKIRITGTKTVAIPRYFDRKIEQIIGEERYRKEIVERRKQRAKMAIARKVAETGADECVVQQQEIERRKKMIQRRSQDLDI